MSFNSVDCEGDCPNCGEPLTFQTKEDLYPPFQRLDFRDCFDFTGYCDGCCWTAVRFRRRMPIKGVRANGLEDFDAEWSVTDRKPDATL